MASCPSAYAYRCGAYWRFAEVSIWMEHGVYHVARHPEAPGGWRRGAAHTLREARKLAASLRRLGF